MSTRIKLSRSKKCCFCDTSCNDELKYGPVYESDGIVTHYFCLLLSSHIEQRGKDNQGILGFLVSDIKKELLRGQKLICYYCGKHEATLRCDHPKCRKLFHLPCALPNGSLHQFYGRFSSYCSTHRPQRRMFVKDKQHTNNDNAICSICYDDLNYKDIRATLWAPCCKRNSWFHRECIQKLAVNAGYFFKCPLCNNNEIFRKEMLKQGIYIPDQDASWEMEPNAFEELLYRHNRCDALTCLCPKGRTYQSRNAKWELVLCKTCGSQGIHMACGELRWASRVWECNECTAIMKGISSKDKSTKDEIIESETVNITSHKGADYSEDSDIEVLVDDISNGSVEKSSPHYECVPQVSDDRNVIAVTNGDAFADKSFCSSVASEEDSASKRKSMTDTDNQILDSRTNCNEQISESDSKDSSNEHSEATLSIVKNNLKRKFQQVEDIENPVPKRPCNTVKCKTVDIPLENEDAMDHDTNVDTWLDDDCSKHINKEKHSESSYKHGSFCDDVFPDVFSEITNNPNACERPELMPKFVKLQDLKFRVNSSNNIQMILYDTFSVNLKMDSNVEGNRTNRQTSTFNLWKLKDSKDSNKEEQKTINFSKECDRVDDRKFRISIELRRLQEYFNNESNVFNDDEYVVRD